MCDPTGISETAMIELGIAVASAAAGVAEQQQMANAQRASNKVQTANALQARADNANQVNLERTQAADGAVQKINENQTALREAQSTVIAQAGPGGQSTALLLEDLGRKGAGYDESVKANLVNTNLALDSQLTNVNRQAANTILNERAPKQVDYLGAALKIGDASYGAYKSAPSGLNAKNSNGLDRLLLTNNGSGD